MTIESFNLNREQIAALIPHAGKMCLLDQVLFWDEMGLHCSATSHLQADNPLRTAQGLPAWIAIEYAAQAMAVHGGLLQEENSKPRVGYIAVLKDVTWTQPRLDLEQAPLEIEVAMTQFLVDSRSYSFHVSCGGKEIIVGEALVVLA